eukprot:m.232962 g.232962  ORF g.232962 m.232962 type:complete len:629 (+) comp33630_c0_seq1:225-2111(+)
METSATLKQRLMQLLIKRGRVEIDALLRRITDTNPKRLCVAIDDSLTTRINVITGGLDFLTQRGVSKLYKLEPTTNFLVEPDSTWLILTPPSVALAKTLASKIQLLNDSVTTQLSTDVQLSDNFKLSDNFHIIVAFTPRRSLVCEAVFEEQGVFGDVTFESLPLQLLPIDTDCASFHMPGFFTDCFLHNDYTNVPVIANAVADIEAMCGEFHSIHGVGGTSRMVADLIVRAREKREEHLIGSTALPLPSGVTQVVLFDRPADFLSPLCNQLTYAGLVDDIWGMDGGSVKLSHEIIEGTKKESGATAKDSKLQLNGEMDKIYETIKDLNFSMVPNYLSRKCRDLGSSYDERHSAAGVTELRQFVSKLGGLQAQHRSLEIHLRISAKIMESHGNDSHSAQLEAEHSIASGSYDRFPFVLEDIHQQLPLTKSGLLQNLCLLSVAECGVKPAQWNTLVKSFYHAYGHEHMSTFAKLQKLGLFSKAPSSGRMAKLRKRLKLISQEQTHGQGFTLFGMKPLSAALIHTIATDNTIDTEISRHLNVSPSFSIIQPNSTTSSTTSSTTTTTATTSSTSIGLTLVVFLGGVTCSELTALRELGHGKYVFATTGICNAKSLLKPFIAVRRRPTVHVQS